MINVQGSKGQFLCYDSEQHCSVLYVDSCADSDHRSRQKAMQALKAPLQKDNAVSG